MILSSAQTRIVRSTSATIGWQPVGSDGEPADPGTVTVGVTRSDGTDVIAAGASTGGTGDDVRTFNLLPVDTEALDRLTATWTSAGVALASTVVDVVGAVYFTAAELRATEPSTSDTTRDPLPAVQRVRSEVEALFEDVCGCAFVPRFGITRTHVHRGYVVLDHPYTRSIRWVRSTYYGDDPVSLTDDELSTLFVSPDGVLCVPYVGDEALVEVGYEHGLDTPPVDLKRAALVAARARLNMARSTVPDRATSMQLPDGGSVTLATPGVGTWHTGIPEVDEVLKRYRQSGPTLA